MLPVGCAVPQALAAPASPEHCETSLCLFPTAILSFSSLLSQRAASSEGTAYLPGYSPAPALPWVTWVEMEQSRCIGCWPRES